MTALLDEEATKRPEVTKGPKRRPPPQRHQWVRQWMIARSKPLLSLVDETLAKVTRFEQTYHPRLRKRRAADRRSGEDLLHALIANLAYASLSPPLPTGRLAIRAGNAAKGASRHDNSAFGKG
jgi:hypothetical protein